jgi:gliding motility-associated-like protein
MTSCDPTQPNGSAEASVPGGPAGFTFEWFRGATTNVANKIGSTASINELQAGVYRAKVTETASGCSGTADVTITFAVVTPTMSSVVTPVTTCNPFNGNIVATPSVDTPADYTFFWYDGPAVKPITDYADTDNVLGNLPPGQYTVRATNNVRHCNVAPITVTVLDNSPAITITLNSAVTQLPSDCASSDGEMEVDVASPGNTLGFRIEWFRGRAPFTNPSIKDETGLSVSKATGLATGIYTVIATDLHSGCSKTEEFYLPFANAHEIEFVAKDDVITCVPGNDGSATVKIIPSPDDGSITFDEADYDIFVYTGTNDPGPSGAAIDQLTGIIAVTDYTTTVPLTPGRYTFVAVSKAPETLNCRSFPLMVEIEKDAKDPVLALDILSPNTNCAGAPAGTGEIAVSADGESPNNYTFEWFAGTSTADAPIVGGGINGEHITGLLSGFYTVRITNNSPISTGCSATTLIPVSANPMVVNLDATGMTLAGLTMCDITTGVALNTGSATVTGINENGGAGNLANYNFVWTDAAGTSLQTGASATLTNRAAGNYFVQATNNTTFCFTNFPFNIIDNTIGTTVVVLNEFENAERCIAPKTGRLEVIETSGSSPTYSFEWYAGPGPSGSIVGTSPELTGIAVPSGQTETLRTIKVVNSTNNCWALDTYSVPLVVNEVQATVSASPLTNCISPDGSIFGTVTNDNSLDYSYAWSVGSTPKASPDHTGKQVINLPAGSYNMVATDNGDAFCVSAPLTVIINDERVFPPVATSILSPVTNCDITKANGGASASVNGDITLYVFDWYAGTTVAGTPFITGPEAGGLTAGTYIVRATDRISGCTNTAAAEITLMLTPVPDPDVTVLSDVTSCVLDNGAVSAAVNGNTADYIFNWYIGSTPTSSIDYTGEVVDSLAIGTYTVVATSRITGCVSGPDSGTIVVNRTYPDFAFKIIPASCESDNGFASLVMASNVPIERIEWLANNELIVGPNLENIGAGTYTVTVTSQLGCETTKEVIIGTEIRPFNGVSRNGDGRNDIFQVSCIENFPQNLVKIFNRAGTMVYMGEGYDNVEIYFDGKSNKGLSPMGFDLPDGTYYYVIDKRDGSKPLAGYLELVK